MRRRQGVAVYTIVVMALLLSGCPLQPPGGGGGRLVYAGPTEVRLRAGETLAPTDIVFVGVTDGRGQFVIDGMRATRQIGDSLDWDGEPLPGVRLSLRLRVVWYPGQEAQLAGTVRLEIDGAQAVAGAVDEEAPVRYRVPVTYRVARGATIPGTTVIYNGESDRGAELLGLNEYPYRKIADSILWEGFLRPDVGLSVNLRVAYFNANSLEVAGVATVVLHTGGGR
jgi:hypothetical protein